MKPVASIPALAMALIIGPAVLSTPAAACIPPAGGCCTGSPFARTQNGTAYTCKVTACSTGGHIDRRERCYIAAPRGLPPIAPQRPTIPGTGTHLPAGQTIPGTKSGSTQK